MTELRKEYLDGHPELKVKRDDGEPKIICSSVEMTELLKELRGHKSGKIGGYRIDITMPLLIRILEKLLICNGAKDES